MVTVGLSSVIDTVVHSAGLREVVSWQGVNHFLILGRLVDGHLRACLRHGVEKPGFVEEEVERRTTGPNVADISLATAGHARKHYRGSSLDGKEKEVEDVAAHVSDTSVRISEGEDEIGAPFCGVTVRSNSGRVEGLDEMQK